MQRTPWDLQNANRTHELSHVRALDPHMAPLRNSSKRLPGVAGEHRSLPVQWSDPTLPPGIHHPESKVQGHTTGTHVQGHCPCRALAGANPRCQQEKADTLLPPMALSPTGGWVCGTQTTARTVWLHVSQFTGEGC